MHFNKMERDTRYFHELVKKFIRLLPCLSINIKVQLTIYESS